MTKTNDKIKEAKELIQKEEQKKQQACWKDIQEVLNKHGYVLQVQNNFILTKK